MSETLDKIKGQIEGNDVILYMKGSPEMPQCGFSARKHVNEMSIEQRVWHSQRKILK